MRYYRTTEHETRPIPPEYLSSDPESPASLDIAISLLLAGGTPQDEEQPKEAPEDVADGVLEARADLRAQGTYFRRKIVRQLILVNSMEDWQEILSSFLSNPAWRKRYVVPIKDPRRVLEEDMRIIREEIGTDINRARYIAISEMNLRLAQAQAQSLGLSARDRSAWLKQSIELNQTLGILKRVVHIVPGKGTIPVGPIRDSDDDENDEEYEDGGSYKIPSVRKEGDVYGAPSAFDA